jgi:hypothetical protein
MMRAADPEAVRAFERSVIIEEMVEQAKREAKEGAV